MAKRRKVSNPLALAVLAELGAEPMHPYEMGRRLKEHGKDRNIKYNRSSLYMVVEQLRKAGFVAEQETVRDTQRPERTVYAVTPEGQAELQDWMREWIAEPQEEYPAFGVALCLLVVLPTEESAELLGRRLEALDARIDTSRAMLRKAEDMGVHPMFVVEEEYALALLEAERRYTENLIRQIGDPDFNRTLQEFMRSLE
ncbi:PadR family transcriptional regulator [Kitasatospora aureofaciens]|uniref:PadR family transcriptional regulator n=1 Tax=Kitasatospora aureofaciens TaxID=1894 RepID=A0A1E7MWA7_KITAU|nr:PadR family transcriptional regulator [Kitasatospora aureofaciens]QEU99464.1 PadR family transcriptional regulator [Streptomyces viridifaciens]ARF78250.1 PadR family transcriptional regulator [Kitasatospora aureofaciens]OEV32710.1 PadR family transcriptional regulator [Kitasatospora aureofaciens]UKZ05551.1 PadR family transcriptional regulator [Streptomyces viridifaciens]GGU80626.1 PadR family transcriptional regulator [Kitasatospora aureofaciens]